MISKVVISILLFALFTGQNTIQAEELHIPRTISEYRDFLNLSTQSHFFVPGGSVAWADYSLLKRDFPFLKNDSNAQIDSWIIRHHSYVSEYQIRLNEIRNKPFEVDRSDARVTYRDEGEGRAGNMEVLDPQGRVVGVINLKGVGVNAKKLARNFEVLEEYRGAGSETEALNRLQQLKNTNGFMLPGEAFMELAVTQTVQKIYDIENAKLNTNYQMNGVYFLLELPIEVYRGESAGPVHPVIFARQANFGRIWSMNLPHRLDGRVNVKQLTYSGTVIDGGTVTIDPRFLDTADMLNREIKVKPWYLMGEALHKAYLSQGRQALDQFMAKVSSPLSSEWESLAKPHLQSTRVSCEELPQCVDRVLTWILEDVEARVSLADILLAAQDRERKEILKRPLAQKVIRELLKIPSHKIDSEFPHTQPLWRTTYSGDVSMRRRGLLLLPSLADRVEALYILKSEIAVRPEMSRYLSETIAHFDYSEVVGILDQVIEANETQYRESVNRLSRQHLEKQLKFLLFKNRMKEFGCHWQLGS